MHSFINENKIIIILQIIKQNLNLSVRHASKIYQMLHTTLIVRQNGYTSNCDCIPTTKNLTVLKKKIFLNIQSI